jgi:hypothetical protein
MSMMSGDRTKLSPLQKQILLLALENKEREGRGFDWKAGGADVYYSEILSAVYHFPLRKDYGGRGPRQLPCCRAFAPSEIGKKRYCAAHATISRSVLRLHVQGVAQSVRSKRSTWAGCNLTPAGVALARALREE